MRKVLVVTALLLGLAALAAARGSAAQNLALSQLRVENVTDSSAILAFSTNVASSTVIKYGTDRNNLDQTAQAPWGRRMHRVTISNLKPGTKYYWQVQTGQALGSGQSATSDIQSFTTQGGNLPQSDQGGGRSVWESGP